MKQAIGVFAALLASGEAGKSGEHPIEKIINLLKGLESQAVEEGKSEALSFQKIRVLVQELEENFDQSNC